MLVALWGALHHIDEVSVKWLSKTKQFYPIPRSTLDGKCESVFRRLSQEVKVRNNCKKCGPETVPTQSTLIGWWRGSTLYKDIYRWWEGKIEELILKKIPQQEKGHFTSVCQMQNLVSANCKAQYMISLWNCSLWGSGDGSAVEHLLHNHEDQRLDPSTHSLYGSRCHKGQ